MDRANVVTCVEPGWHEARAIAHDCVSTLPSERIDLEWAYERICAEAVVALTPLPPMPVSAMDGWATAGAGPWVEVGEALAGSIWPDILRPGEAVRIATGAVIPDGAQGVLRREHGVVDETGRIHGDVVAGQDVRPAGEEAGLGEVLIPAGAELTPARIGLAAAAGHNALEVVLRPTARVLVLGDELLSTGMSGAGRVRDSLGPQLPGWLARLGVDLLGIVRVEDTRDGHVHALTGAQDVDLVITTGGTAAGPVDHLHEAIARTGGGLLVDSVACRPGHPMLLAGWPSGPHLIGLPGNPLAAIVALLTLCAPLVAGLSGRPMAGLSEVVLHEHVTNRGSKTRLVPCRLEDGRAVPLDHIGSGMLRGLANADGLAVVGTGEGARESFAQWLLLP